MRNETMVMDGAAVAAALRVLVVDDSRAQRRLLALSLQKGGYVVAEAGSGDEAMALCAATPFDIVISDWMMPGMTGPDFCRAFRALPREGYGYFILLTSKADSDDVASGLDCGADDFLAKPVHHDELRARLRVGERLIAMQAELVAKNRLLRQKMAEIQGLYDAIDRDLVEARKLQQVLVRERRRDFGMGQATALLRPSGHVGGDLPGYFQISDRRVAIFSIDVSGHGIASAMLTARLAGLMSGAVPDQNIAMTINAYGAREAWPPEMVAYRFNRLMFSDFPVDQYLTLGYAEIDLETGRIALVQAGHPHPVILRRDGAVEFLGEGGLPIGLIPGATYHRIEARLTPGDRLLILSDGVTECPSPRGELGEVGLRRILPALARLDDSALLDALVWSLADYAGTTEFPDDVSGAMFRYGPVEDAG